MSWEISWYWLNSLSYKNRGSGETLAQYLLKDYLKGRKRNGANQKN